MASELTDVSVQTIRSANAAVLSSQLMRKGEHDEALAAVQSEVDSVAAQVTTTSHAAATTPATNESIDLAINGQAITGEVRIPDESPYQEAGSLSHEEYSLTQGALVDLGKLKVTIADVMADGASAVLDEDYIYDGDSGIVTVLAGSILIGAGISLFVFDYAEVLQGPALEITADGLQVKKGPSRENVSRGDHTHANLHLALSVDGTAVSETLELAVNPGQRIAGEVKLATSSGLTVTDGLKVDPEVIATKASVDSVITDVEDHEARVTALESGGAASVSVEDTDSVNLEIDEESEITAQVIVGAGLSITESGVVPDYDFIAAKSVTDNHEGRLDQLESGTTLPCPLPMIVPCSGDTETFNEGVLVTFRMPGAVTFTDVRASLTSAATSGTVEIDILVDGTSILSTLLTINATEKTSATATPAVISFSDIGDDAEVTIQVTNDADGLGTGLKVALIGVVQ